MYLARENENRKTNSRHFVDALNKVDYKQSKLPKLIKMSSVFSVVKAILDFFVPLITLWNGRQIISETFGISNIVSSFVSQSSLLENSSMVRSGPSPVRIGESIISKDADHVSFYLYPNSANVNYSETLIVNNSESVTMSSYKSNLPLTILIHGFVTNSSDEFAQTIKNGFLETGYPSNIIVVDWGPLSTPTGTTPHLYYNMAAANIPAVANRIAEIIFFLIRINLLLSPMDIQIIGYSLGAHVAGVTGQIINSTLGNPIKRITGLDPASPEFQHLPSNRKLDKTDALFVDVYHTNQGMKGYLGLLGHVDFFPNGGGPYQPGCSQVTEFSDVFTGTCSHAKAIDYFDKSIRNSSITACKCTGALKKWTNRVIIPEDCKNPNTCEDQVIFGQFCSPNATGVYYLEI